MVAKMGFFTYFCLPLFAAAFIYLWQTSHRFRFYAKFLYYNVCVVIIGGLFVFFYAPFRPKDPRNMNPVAWLYTQLFKVFGIESELRNAHYLKSDQPLVIVSNHQSSLDVIMLMRYLPDRFSVLAKKELLYAGFFGLGAWLCGAVFVDRLNHERARHTMSQTAKLIQDRKLKLWIFPEGTRNSEGSMLPFKKGAFHLAIQAQVPIVPIVMSSYKTFYDKKKKIFESGKVIVEVLPPVEVTKDTEVSELTDKVRSQMLDKFEVLSKETLSSCVPLESRI